ncbi:hypothetical protein GCQ56_16260 [Marinifilum sp. N1E240]|uniref:hypothetical protein n=1 Tax=Marinifilum sp. N1E240 TaxID=2608082 RepID=UPI00128BCFE9|nr:hypothetical protein [Marinifilum sp. N1E240]MPQ48559.1 hypothetical protein [Marinifilum sp. N1E240]
MKKIVLIFTGIFLASLSYSQERMVNQDSEKFIKIAAGLNSVKLRDMATSPLFYTGSLKHFELGHVKYKNGKERDLFFSLSTGVADNSTNNHTASTQISIYNLSYSKLYPIWQQNKWDLKVGGELRNSFHIRNNPSFQNNATGLEVFSTLFASGKISWDISNKTNKRAKFLFIPMNFKPRKRELSFRMNLAVMNNTYRNGYVYNNNSDITNDPNVFDDYELKIFSGYRIGTELNYTVFLKNKNAIRFGYEFDAYKTGGNLDKFEMANYKLKIALLFKTK